MIVNNVAEGGRRGLVPDTIPTVTKNSIVGAPGQVLKDNLPATSEALPLEPISSIRYHTIP